MPRKERDDVSYLADMLRFSREVLSFTHGRSRADYDADPVLRRAVERATELIGEAASHVSKQSRARHPDVPWREIIGQRNVLIHGYGDVDDDLLWNLVEKEIPTLVILLGGIVPGEPPE
jgi:uncharacterized protein with HEPN domain